MAEFGYFQSQHRSTALPPGAQREQLCPSRNWLKAGSFSFPLCSPKQEQFSTSQRNCTGTDWSEQKCLKVIALLLVLELVMREGLQAKTCFRQAENFSALVWL